MTTSIVKIDNLIALLDRIKVGDFQILKGGKVRCSSSHDSPFYGGEDCGKKKKT
jgi:hypothetical protein